MTQDSQRIKSFSELGEAFGLPAKKETLQEAAMALIKALPAVDQQMLLARFQKACSLDRECPGNGGKYLAQFEPPDETALIQSVKGAFPGDIPMDMELSPERLVSLWRARFDSLEGTVNPKCLADMRLMMVPSMIGKGAFQIRPTLHQSQNDLVDLVSNGACKECRKIAGLC